MQSKHNMTLFSRLTRDFDSNAQLIILESLPFYKGATFTSDQLRRLAQKLLIIADEESSQDVDE